MIFDNKNTKFLDNIQKRAGLLLMEDFLIELDKKIESDEYIDDETIVFHYQIHELNDYLLFTSSSDIEQHNKRIKNKIHHSNHYENERYIADINVSDNGILLNLRTKLGNSYISTDAFLMELDKEYFFRSRYLNVPLVLHNTDMDNITVTFNSGDGDIYNFVKESGDELDIKEQLNRLLYEIKNRRSDK